MNTNTNTQVAVPTAPKTCECGDFVNAETGARITCQRSTTREFAPGHDAKLKGFLIRTGAEGQMVRAVAADGTTREMTAVAAASRYGFGHMVADGIAKAKEKAFARLIRETTKQARGTHKTANPTVTAKVGRWVYEGTVTDSPNHGEQFTYTNRKGVQVTTTKFRRV